jgi:hypothetical protein
MIPSRRQEGRRNRAATGSHAGWLVLLGSVCLAAVSPPVWAQAPTSSREELMRKWDVNRDGKVDTGEAEIARSQMRRARNDAMLNTGNDPLTGKPRAAIDPVTGRPVPPSAAADRGGLSTPAEDDGLILVPGNGERPGATGSAAAGQDMPPRPSQREREALPGTRVPSMSSTIPSVSPRPPTGGSLSGPGAGSGDRSPEGASAAGRQGLPGSRDAAGADLSSRARLLPGMSPQQNPGVRDPRSLGTVQERQQQGARPGIISGGMRAGVPGARPGSGAVAPTGDLNAGRLPGGLPQTRGVAPGTVPGPRRGPAEQSNAGRLAGPVPTVPRPGIGPYRGPASSSPPSAGVPTVPRPGVRQPDGGRPVSRPPATVPRVPRMTTDELYGR